MHKLLSLLILCSLLVACYETVSEKKSREDLERRVKQLERER